MSSEISTSFKQSYHDMLEIGLQQQGSRLRPAVRVESVNAKYDYFDRVNSVSAVEKTSRHAPTPQIDTPHVRRRVDMRDFHFADMIDKQDVIRATANPESAYVQNAIYSLGREMDNQIISAAFGTAYEGETGGTSTTFPTATQQIAHGSAGMTVDKLREAKKILDSNEVGDEPRFIACTAQQIDDLLGTTEVTSTDYNSVKALVQGEVNTFLGFTFIRTELIDISGSTRSCIAWSRSGLLLGVGIDIETDISVRNDMSNAIQVYARATFGATRMYEEKVVEIQCTES